MIIQFLKSVIIGLNASSIKTRIETLIQKVFILSGLEVLTPLPLKQGLKHEDRFLRKKK